MTPPSPQPEVAIWGTFDVENFGDLLFPRIFERELKRRLPDATVRSFSPLGNLHSTPLDGGFVSEPLGDWSRARVEELGRDLDLLAIGGGEVIHPHDEYYAIWYGIDRERAERLRPSRFFVEGLDEDESTQPVAWHSVGIPFELEGDFAERVRRACSRRAYVSVRDEVSLARLQNTGVEREVVVAPDSALLVDRTVRPDVASTRRDYLRALGAFPPAERPLLVQGSRALLPFVDEVGRVLAEALSEHEPLPVVLVEAGPCHGDGEFADALAPHLPADRTYRMRDSIVVDDIVSAISNSRGFLGISLHGSLVAFTTGVPFGMLDLVGYSKLRAFASMAGAEANYASAVEEVRPVLSRVLDGVRATGDLRPLVRRVDDHFDVLAELAERSAAGRADGRDGAPPELQSRLERAERRYAGLRTAYDVRGRALVRERATLAALVAPDADLHGRGATVDHLERRLAEMGDELTRARQGLAAQEQALAAARTLISDLQRTRLFRYSAPLRRAYANLRSRRP